MDGVCLTGSKIKALRAKTNTYIKTPVRGEEPVFVVTGRREDVAAAKREILSASEHFSQIRASRLSAGTASPAGVIGPRPDTGGQVTVHVRVPYRVVGLVVGPKGATIKRIQQDSSTYIVTPSRDREPVFEVTGSCEGVEKARRDIESYIALRTGTVPDPVIPHTPMNNELKDIDPRLLLNSLLKSAPISGSSVYNNAVNVGGRLSTLPSDNGTSVGFKLAQQQYPALMDYEPSGNKNHHYHVPQTTWPDLSSLGMRSLASLLPHIDEFKYPSAGVDIPSLDHLVVAAAAQSPSLLDGGLSRGHNGSATSSPPVDSLGGLCVMCNQCPVSTALVPCGHNLFCKQCADSVLSRPDMSDRRCPVCGEQASLAVKILS